MDITFAELPIFHYGVIMIDPPWEFENWSEKGEGRNPKRHYETMSIEAIKALPVGHLAAKDCALFLWATSPIMNELPGVFDAWGFRFSGKAFCWAKCTKQSLDRPCPDLPINDDYNWKMTTGYGTRSNTEDCWLGMTGNPPRLDASVRELIVAPTREHSRKPDEAYDRARRLYPGPCADIFSRENRDGWDTWGHQTGHFNDVGRDWPRADELENVA
ncbi:MAG: DNA methyltransferase [Rhodospirillaceae bacterium]|nr:DNA methyltransferase [Rhodospirillaceae bacterium]